MPPNLRVATLRTATLATLSLAAASTDAQSLTAAPAGQTVEVTGHYINSLGSSDAASAGTITSQLIGDRPLLRPGNLLEYVPGMVVTQHSGPGKANQYFLRGFNLDHGTDFATWVAGMPVNLRTHGHGQGYTDLNFIIPELISRVDYWKGPYYAEIGDFASAGGAHMLVTDQLRQGIALGTLGSWGYRRALLAASPALGPGILTYGLEYEHSDGPWEVPNDFKKWNGLLRYAMPMAEGSLSVTAMAYTGQWSSSDQVAKRAIDSGLIGRYGTLDASGGGDSDRYSLSADYAVPLAGGEFSTTAYWFKYRLNLFSNFSYFLNDPVNGDQFEQADDRNVYGWTGQWAKKAELFGKPSRTALGFELRQDRIDPVGLYATRQRERLSTTREDNVVEGSAGIYVSNDTQWAQGFRSIVGLRYDRYRFEVDSNVPDNSGTVDAGITSPKLSLVFGPWNKTEYFVNAGYGFHSNDARGVTIRVDPANGDPVDAATPLVRSKGAELGLRSELVPNVQSSLALWALKLDSELVFIGDAGNTEAGRPSDRYGVEWSNRWRPQPWMSIDLDLSWNHARFTGDAPEGNYIPGAPSVVAQAGIAVDRYGPWSGGMFLRYIGSYPLTEDNSVRSQAQTVVDAQVGYEVARDWRLRLDIFNVFNSQTNDVAYFYESRLPGEPSGVEDIHFHPNEPRSVRVSLSYRF